MKFEGHYILTVFIALFVSLFVEPKVAILIGLAHFVPSIDWIMKRLDALEHHHRKLVHNIFVIPLSYTAFYLLTRDFIIPIYCALSTSLHLFIDYADKKDNHGLALFFPFSAKRYKWPLLSEKFDNIVVDIGFIGSIIIALVLALK